MKKLVMGIIFYSLIAVPLALGKGAPVLEGKEATDVLDMVNVKAKPYGAKGDGVWNSISHSVSGTNDTSAINAAIAVANVTKQTLYFPVGRYLVSPGALSLIKTHIYGPEAIIQAFDATQSFLLPVGNYGTGANPLFQTVKLRALLGRKADISYMYQGTKYGSGLYLGFERCYGSWFEIGYIAGFVNGIHLDGNSYDTHIGSNRFKISFLAGNTYGIFLHCGEMQVEGNKFDIDYIYANAVHVYMLTSNNTPGWPDGAEGAPFITSNNFDITVMECNVAGAESTGFYLVGSNIFINNFSVYGSLVPSPGDEFVINVTGSVDNRFNLCYLPDAKIYMTTGNIIDTHSFEMGHPLAVGRGRSSRIGSAAPNSAACYNRVGDICWNTVPVAGGGGVLLWTCTTAGAPGTWTALTLN